MNKITFFVVFIAILVFSWSYLIIRTTTLTRRATTTKLAQERVRIQLNAERPNAEKRPRWILCRRQRISLVRKTFEVLLMVERGDFWCLPIIFETIGQNTWGRDRLWWRQPGQWRTRCILQHYCHNIAFYIHPHNIKKNTKFLFLFHKLFKLWFCDEICQSCHLLMRSE